VSAAWEVGPAVVLSVTAWQAALLLYHDVASCSQTVLLSGDSLHQLMTSVISQLLKIQQADLSPSPRFLNMVTTLNL